MLEHYQISGRSAAEISASIEGGVRSGTLATGATLPPVRTLAGVLGVSPATVAAAYRSLRERGLLETAGRGGTRVRGRPPIAVRAVMRPPVTTGLVDLSSGMPAQRLLPNLAAPLRRIAAGIPPAGHDAGGPLPELLALARTRLRAEGLPIPDDAPLTITGGALDAIERTLGAHLRIGDRVAVEDPGWGNLLDLVAALGLTPLPIPVDDAGPRPDGLAAALAAGARAAVVTTRAQNPTGASLTAARARDLRALLREYPQTLVIEDDHSGELAEQPLHCLAGDLRSWAFVRSVSKPYGPDLRLSALAGDEVTIARVEGRMRVGPGWVSTLLQRLVIDLWTSPAAAADVAAAREAYRRRRTGLRAELAAHGVTTTAADGINVWVPVADETSAVAVLRDAGYAVAPGAMFRLSSPPGIRITVSTLDEDRIASLAAVVARAARPDRRPRPVSA